MPYIKLPTTDHCRRGPLVATLVLSALLLVANVLSAQPAHALPSDLAPGNNQTPPTKAQAEAFAKALSAPDRRPNQSHPPAPPTSTSPILETSHYNDRQQSFLQRPHDKAPVSPKLEVMALLSHSQTATATDAGPKRISDESTVSKESMDDPETIIVRAILNQVEQGDFFVLRDASGHIFIRSEDLVQMGFTSPPDKLRAFAGEPYLALQDLPDSTYALNEMTMELNIEVQATYFSETSIDLSPKRDPGVVFPRDNSLFYNYGLEYYAQGENLETDLYQLTNEVGIRLDPVLFLTDSVYTDSDDGQQLTRLMTSLIHDDRDTLRRSVIGDFFVGSGELNSLLNMGGVSISKVYDIDPYLLEYPAYNLSGMTRLPADIELYMNGNRILSEKVPPGPFKINDINYNIGTQDIELVIRDAMGRVTQSIHPYYFTERLLRDGFQEYSYNLGALRENYGNASSDYSKLAWFAAHRFGFTNAITLGVKSEGGDDLFNLGTGALFKLGTWGVGRVDIAGSQEQGDSAVASSLGYDYRSRSWSGGIRYNHYSEHYAILSNRSWGEDISSNLSTNLSYADRRLGSISMTYQRTDRRVESDLESYGLSYSKNLSNRAYVSVNYTHLKAEKSEDEVYLTLNYYLGPRQDITLATSHRHNDNSDLSEIELRKNAPVGPGYGWRAAMTRDETDSSTITGINPMLQYNGDHGIYRAEYSHQQNEETSKDFKTLSLRASGGLVFLGNKFGLVRPVYDSFGLVKVGEIEDIKVYVNNQDIGRTDKKGTLIVPELSSYYENQVRIEDSDIPIDYLMAQVRQDISPPLRSGSCVNFEIQRYQAFTGTLQITTEGTPLAPGFQEVTLTTTGGTSHFLIGEEGDFYFDNSDFSRVETAPNNGCSAMDSNNLSSIGAGQARLLFRHDGLDFTCELNIPETSDQIVDMGNVNCAATALPGQEPRIKKTGSALQAPPPVEATARKMTAVKTPPQDGPTEEPTPIVIEIHFAFDSTEFAHPDDEKKLHNLLTILEQRHLLQILIDSHSSWPGAHSYNQALSERRAQGVSVWLQERGLDPHRIRHISSHGEQQARCHEPEDDCRAMDRRVIIQLVEG